MAEFVLVPGARLGAWAWDAVAESLRSAGHAVYAVTLSGLAERGGPDGDRTGQQQHVDDIVSVVEGNELYDVVLVGHSYSGIPVGQAAGRIGDRLQRVVYVDSSIPADGLSFADGWPEDERAWLAEQLIEGDGTWLPAEAEHFVDQDLSDEAISQLVSRSTPHPGLTLTQPARLPRPIGELPTTYIKCLMAGDTPSPDVQEQLRSPQWHLREMQTGHWPMLSQPAALAKILTEVD
ncbi:pimeloyl-ACP methyl ester carboxylesterase [Kribbella sp. VKM Ac-2569]|uniref:alpha/beta fold hydrolase n=1 Tax=Kribbella sp. VKM Ac-2569 TaxID=2512220 RepID=UPI00102AC2ED|nr:alpha/beta fold hydrolase [Kribbella sp. VKM Ac-2569]RZT13618.1 pimeloyl-ACP methyl ester carboxylesterase [Kribbella sp. VKM Ac-2569]